MEVRAITKYVGISPQKTRWVIDQVRGMQAEQALASERDPAEAEALRHRLERLDRKLGTGAGQATLG